MQYIDNDMDDIFNKAGNNYPLKTDSSDWDAVLAKMQMPQATVTANKKNYGKYTWLLLLLLIPAALIYFKADNVANTRMAKADISNTDITTARKVKNRYNATENNRIKKDNNVSHTENIVAEEINTIKSENNITKNKNIKPSENRDYNSNNALNRKHAHCPTSGKE